MGEIDGDDIAVERGACELQGFFIDGSEGKQVVLLGESGEAGVLVGIGEDEGDAAEDGQVRRKGTVDGGWEGIGDGASLTESFVSLRARERLEQGSRCLRYRSGSCQRWCG